MTTTPFRRPAARRVARAATVVALAAATVLGATGCGGGSTDEPGGLDISSGSRHLKLVAYAVPKPGFDKIIPAFRATPQGHDIGFSQSYGASGDQSRKVARRVPADVVNFSVEPDITRLVKEGVVDEDWKSQAPNNSTPFGSVVALVVRKGNPKNIRSLHDLTRADIRFINRQINSGTRFLLEGLLAVQIAKPGRRFHDFFALAHFLSAFFAGAFFAADLTLVMDTSGAGVILNKVSGGGAPFLIHALMAALRDDAFTVSWIKSPAPLSTSQSVKPRVWISTPALRACAAAASRTRLATTSRFSQRAR